jgi:hypothetical protein
LAKGKRLATLPLTLALSVALFLSLGFSITLLARTEIIDHVENGIYAATVRSVLEDGDLNTINQVYPEQHWLASRTYNFPDFRENGFVGLWLPFFAYGHSLPKLVLGSRRLGSPASQEDVGNALAALVFTLAALILSLYFLRAKLGEKYAKLSIALLCLGSPLLWYTLFEPYGTDLCSMFTLTAGVFLYASLEETRERRPAWWFLLGAFLAFGATVKVYGTVYLLLTLLVGIKKGRRSPELGWMVLGEALILAFHLANQYLKFGMLGGQYLAQQRFYALFSPSVFFLSPLKLLLGPAGGLYVAPIYWLALAGGVLWVLSRPKAAKLRSSLLSLEGALIVLPLLTFLLTSFEMIDEHIGTARRFMTQQLAWFFLLQFLLLRLRKRGKTPFRLGVGFAVAAVLWNALMTIRFAARKENFGASYLMTWQELDGFSSFFWRQLHRAFVAYPMTLETLFGWLPAVALCAWLLVRLWQGCEQGAARARRAALPFLAVPVALYVLASALNLAFNQSNVKKLQSGGFFAKTVIGNGMSIYIYDDLMSVLPKFERDPSLIADAEKIRAKLLNDAAAEVLVDPIGFRADCRRGIFRPSYFDIMRN